MFLCSNCNRKGDKAKTNVVAVKNVEVLGKKLMVIWASGDTVMTKDIFLENSTYSDATNKRFFSGIHEVNNYIDHIHSWASEINMAMNNIRVSEEMGYVKWTLYAIQSQPINGMIPIATNSPITLNGDIT